MSKFAVIRQRSPFIEVSADGQNPLTNGIARKIADRLTYTHMQYLHGEEGYDAVSNTRDSVKTELRRLYNFSANGCLCCLKGWRHTVSRILEEEGFRVQYVNYDPEKPANTYEAHWDRVFDRFEFRPRQVDCLAQIDMHDEGVIEAVTAFGKSFMFAMICTLYPNAKIDIVTKSKSVVATIRNRLTKWIPDVGQVGGGKKRKRRVTVYTADSLKHSDFDADIVLVDEVHELMTDRYFEWLSRYWHARMFGFTATKETRFDNAYERMEGLFGPTIFHMPYPLAEQLGIVVPIICQWLSVEPGWNPCRTVYKRLERKRWGIWRHDYRNRVIAAAAESLVADGNQTLILVETLEHGLFLRQLLPEFQLCYSEQALKKHKRDFYVNNNLMHPEESMTAQRRDQLRRQFEDRQFMGAIATGVWSVGVSFDSLQVMIRADGGSSETNSTQGPGRVCRINPETGKNCGILIDCDDRFDDRFANGADTRRRSYSKHGWTQYLPDGTIWRPGMRTRRVGTRQ